MAPQYANPNFRLVRSHGYWIICALFSLFLPLPLQSQQILFDPGTKKNLYSETEEAGGLDKEELFVLARKWAEGSFKNMLIKPLVYEQEQGKLHIVAGFLSQSFFNYGHVSFSCTVTVEDGKYRYVFTDFTFQGFASISYKGFNTAFPIGPPVSFEHPAVGSKKWILKETNKQIRFMISDLHQTLSRDTYYSRINL